MCYNQIMLEIKNLTKIFGLKTAVDNVSFTVKPGEIFALIGPNGSGKTTIVKTATGLLKPTSGEITINGHNTVKEPVKAKGALGYIPDEPAVWPALTGLEFLHFSGALFGLSEPARQAALPELLGIFGFSGIEHEYFEDYSRGNKQKFAILAALLHKPRLLLIDEPIVGLDPQSAEIAQERFSRFARAGGAVLLVTHTLPVAEAIADRIGILKDGRLAAAGTLSELAKRAGLEAGSGLGEIYKALA